VAFQYHAGRRSAGGGRRPAYRVRQFCLAVLAQAQPLSAAEVAEVEACLPASARSLFFNMNAGDQRHSLQVLHDLQGQGYQAAALWQAALLHDCAKHGGGIRLWHRVVVVLIAAFWPALAERFRRPETPARTSWRYPLWLHWHHPEQGAVMAEAAGCDPVAVRLIARHQDYKRANGLDPEFEAWLQALQAADDDN
jgi:hypothetical protein